MTDERTDEDGVALEKRAARAAVRSAVSALSPAARVLASSRVCQRVMAMEAFGKARTVMLYAPLRDEIDQIGRAHV